MQARMLSGLRERMDVKDDEEWKLIAERITKVAELRRSAPGGPGMMMMMGRGPGGGGPGGPGREEGGGGRGGFRPGGGSAEMTALASALRDKLPDAEIKSRLDRVRDQRKDNEAKLARAQDELRAVLTVRQEAMAVMAGLAGLTETQQVDGVHAPARPRQLGGVVTPVAAGGAEAMHQDQGWTLWLAQHPPVALMPFPPPGAMATPVGTASDGRRLAVVQGASGVGRGGGGGSGGFDHRGWRHGGGGPSLSRSLGPA